MEELLKHIEEIESYCEGHLSDDAKLDFEKRLESSVELRNELDLYLKVRNGLKDLNKEKRLKEELKNADQELDKRTGFNYWVKPLSIAAALAGIILMLWYVYPRRSNSQLLAQKYYVQDPGLPVFMSANSNIQLDRAMQLYQDKNYAEAINLLSGLRKNDTTEYYIGLCDFNLRKDAIQDFDAVYKDKQSVYSDKAGYYEALALLDENKITQARTLIETLCQNKQHPFIENLKRLNQEPELNK